MRHHFDAVLQVIEDKQGVDEQEDSLGQALGIDLQGLQAYDWRALARARGILRGQSLVVMFGSASGAARPAASVARTLGRRYPAGHPCWLIAGAEEPAVEFPLSELPRRRLREGSILYLPGVKGGAPPSSAPYGKVFGAGGGVGRKA